MPVVRRAGERGVMSQVILLIVLALAVAWCLIRMSRFTVHRTEPHIFTCPGCGRESETEGWQIEDGPCKDGRFYCVPCLTKGPCGCTPKWKV